VAGADPLLPVWRIKSMSAVQRKAVANLLLEMAISAKSA
jgi:hypothetical protein